MHRIRLIYEQIEEAKRFLMEGTMFKLRLSLILLDNTAELLMNRDLRYLFAWDDKRGRIIPSKYSEAERKKAEQYFDEKVRLLVKLKKLTKDQQAILVSCHKCRGEMFHAEHIRRPILLPITQLLFYTVLELTLTLRPHSYSISHAEEDRIFLERFGLQEHRHTLLDESSLLQMRDRLIAGVHLDNQGLIQALAEDLLDRINSAIDGLKYVSEGQSEEKIDWHLRYYQFWQSIGYKLAEQGMREPQLSTEFERWNNQGNAAFTFFKVKRWRQTVEAIGRQSNVADALRHYCGIDKRFVPFEEHVIEAVIAYEQMIDMKIEEMQNRS